MLLIELAGTSKSLRHLEDREPSFDFVITSPTKGNQKSGAGFSILCIAVIGGIYLRPGRWVKRLVMEIHNEGRNSGRLFQRRLKNSKLCEWEDDFFTVLGRIQADTNLIDKQLNLWDKAGLACSSQRVVTDHCINMDIDIELVKAINCWQNKSGSEKVGYTMIDRYSTLESLRSTFLRYSALL